MPAKKGIFQKIGDDAVRAKTRRVWHEWFRILDKYDLKKKGHAGRKASPGEAWLK